MHEPAPPRFTKSFELNGQSFSFRFDPVNSKRKQLYQVYLHLEGKEQRFHMQIKNGVFEITDPERIPAEFQALQPLLSKAILES